MAQENKVWLITGVSGGIGKALAEYAALQGHTVIGTLRKEEQINAFEALVPGKTFGILMDVRHFDTITIQVDDLVKKYGKIDVLVNNAGYGLFGAIEEVSLEEAKAQMETNFFGALHLSQKILPYMRKQGGGHIIQISSQAGFRSAPGLGIYNASKYALEGFSEALALEAAPLNIKVTIVEPGPFRTLWAGESSSRAQIEIPDYAATAGALIKTINGYSGNQPNDPRKAAFIIFEAIHSEHPPLRLPLGPEAYAAIEAKLASVGKEIALWKDKATQTQFD